MNENRYALIKNKSELIGAIENTEKLAIHYGFDKKEALLLKLVAEESFSNAYEYSLRGNNHPVQIKWKFENDYFRISVKHPGKSSDFKINPRIVYDMRGRGLQLIYSLMDHIRLYQDCGNVELLMEKLLKRNQGGESMSIMSQPNTSVLVWREDITIKSVNEFKKTMQEFIQSDAPYLILDLQGVQYVNSSGLGVIAESVMKCRKNQKELVVSSINETVDNIFSIVKFHTFIKLFDTKEEALEFCKDNN